LNVSTGLLVTAQRASAAEVSVSSFLCPTSVLIHEVGILILIRILFATQPWKPNSEKLC